MADPTATRNIPALAGPVADNGEDVSPQAATSAGNDSSRGASVLRKFVEILEKSEQGAKEVGTFREWINSMVDDDDIEEGLDMRDSRGRTLLHIAAIEGLAETAKRLIDAGAVLDAQDEWGDTPLIDACGEGDGEDGHIEVVKLLLEKGARAGIFGNEHESPLYRAVINGHHRIVQYLLFKVEWDLDVGEEIYNITPLHAAASAEDGEMVRYLRDKGARLDLRDTDGWTPLMTAIASQKEKAMEELLRRRNDEDLQLETEDSEGRSPILRAAKDGFLTGLRLLMEAGANVNVRDRDKRQPLHLACTGDDENGQYNEVVRVLLNQNPRPYTEAVMKEMENAVELAFEYDHNERAEAILDVLAEASPWVSHTLLWAAGKTKKHQIAASLLKRQLKESPTPDVEISEGWTAIEWAAYARNPQTLWLLIASSPQSKETKNVLKSAKALLKRPKGQKIGPVGNPEIQETDQIGDAKKDSEEIKRQGIEDIINNPPVGLMCSDNSTYDQLKCEDKHSSDDYNATIIQFYKTQRKFESIIRPQTIRETIYGGGPADIMKKVGDKLTELAGSHFEGLEKAHIAQRPIFMDSVPKFTWIHLPATNVVWMEHLLQRVMEDNKEPVSRFNQAKSFFKDSWIEIPDKLSLSRMMRPKFVSRDRNLTGIHVPNSDKIPQIKSDDEGDGGVEKQAEIEEWRNTEGRDDADGQKPATQKQNGNQDDEVNNASSVAATAIYCVDDPPQPPMQMEKRLAKKKETRKTETSVAVQADAEFRRKRRVEHQKFEEENSFDYVNKLVHAREKYQSLLDEYSGKIIHGSSTLDESYYHFGADEDSSKDKDRRNKSQVVTGSWLKERSQRNEQVREKQEHQGQKQDSRPQKGPKREKQKQNEQETGDQSHTLPKTDLYWLLIRVNQLWIWTINDQFLISASSHPIDDSEDELLNGILDRLEKQREAAGSDSQPGSTAEMSQLIVDYCVETYERKPGAHDEARPEDCKLTGFPSIRQVFSKSINSIARDETKLSEEFSEVTKRFRVRLYENTREHRNSGGNMDKELAKATDKAKELSSSVKDILDELSMLETIVEYQQDVQKAMKRNYAPRTNGKPNIPETEYTATYIINDIRRLYSVAERVHAAAELAIQQGRVLMVFTVVTTLFLPLSFLTSLFALDVASFQQAPPWALGVIFSVSAAFFIPTVIAAFSWERSKKYLRKLLPNRTRDEHGGSSSEPGLSVASVLKVPQRPTIPAIPPIPLLVAKRARRPDIEEAESEDTGPAPK